MIYEVEAPEISSTAPLYRAKGKEHQFVNYLILLYVCLHVWGVCARAHVRSLFDFPPGATCAYWECCWSLLLITARPDCLLGF